MGEKCQYWLSRERHGLPLERAALPVITNLATLSRRRNAPAWVHALCRCGDQRGRLVTVLLVPCRRKGRHSTCTLGADQRPWSCRARPQNRIALPATRAEVARGTFTFPTGAGLEMGIAQSSSVEPTVSVAFAVPGRSNTGGTAWPHRGNGADEGNTRLSSLAL